MPTKTKTTKKASVKKRKRHGQHQKRTKTFHKTYLPYLPLAIAMCLSIFLGGFQGATSGVLAYATNTSVSGLLQATNSRRANNGQQSLALNQQLINAAQAKANDMVARDYWSHNTPDGQEPWIFFEEAGYAYTKAGENLAYGFPDSNETVTGWMNSPTHRDNMLDPAFTEVGFGFTNGPDYIDHGNQTVVVAMYGKPQTLGASAQSNPTPTPTSEAPTPAQPTLVAQSQPTTQQTNNNQPAQEQPSQQTNNNITTSPASFAVPNSINLPGLEPASKNISQIETLTGGTVSWAYTAVATALSMAVIGLMFKHAAQMRKIFIKGEQFVLHHPVLDSAFIGIIILALTLTRTVGVIQ